jgi:hypothetical protein
LQQSGAAHAQNGEPVTTQTGVDRYGFDMSAMTPQGPLQRRGHTRSRQLADEDQFRRCRYAL